MSHGPHLAGATLLSGTMTVYLGISTILAVPTSTQASAPPPRALLAHASRVMDRISSVAATGAIRERSGRASTYLHVTARCDASAVPPRDRASNGIGVDFLRVRAHLWGRLRDQPFDRRYIVIGAGRLPRTWERSAGTSNRWQEDRTEGVSLVPTDSCSILFMSPGGVPTNTPTTYVNLGETTVVGADAWHVRMRVNPPGEHWQFDWYIDALSYRVLRSVTVVRDSGSSSTRAYTYSRFGAPLRITAPLGARAGGAGLHVKATFTRRVRVIAGASVAPRSSAP